MKHTLSILTVSAALLAGCSGGGGSSMPDWCLNPRNSADELQACGVGSGPGEGYALEEARVEARNQLATSLEVNVESMSKRFFNEVGIEENSAAYRNFTSATRQLVDQRLRMSTQVTASVRGGDSPGRFVGYALFRVPIGDAAQDLASRISGQEELYTRFLESETFQEMVELLSGGGN